MITPRWGYVGKAFKNPVLLTGLMIYAPLVLENCKLQIDFFFMGVLMQKTGAYSSQSTFFRP